MPGSDCAPPVPLISIPALTVLEYIVCPPAGVSDCPVSDTVNTGINLSLLFRGCLDMDQIRFPTG